MNEFWFLAFVITPAFVVIVGYIAVRLHEWDLDRKRTSREPG